MSETEKQSPYNFEIKRRHWLFLIAFMVLTTVASLFYWARFETYSVCFECALRRQAVVWEVPFVHRKLYETAELVSSPLSDVILEHELADDHEHEWQFVFGSGNGSPMVFGTTRSIASAMTSSTGADFLGQVMRHSGRGEARKWLDGFRDEDRAEWCRCIAEAMNGRQFDASHEFEEWLAQAIRDNEEFWH